MLFNKAVYCLTVEAGENLDVTLRILVADIEPELIELIRSGAFWIEPDVSALCLSKLLSVSLCNERTGQGKCLNLIAQCSAYELRTRRNIYTLVLSSELELHAFVIEEAEKAETITTIVGK